MRRGAPRRVGVWIVPALLFALALAGCKRQAPRTTLVVLAASSLTEVFGDLEAAFEREHPDVDVVSSFAGSQALRLQIEQGAAADVFASANAAHFDALEKERLVGDRTLFARNGLVIVVPPGNPAGLHSLEDLPRAERIVVGTEDVPVGSYTAKMLERADARFGPGFAARVAAHVVSREHNVRLVLAKVEMGEADAAVVYATDAAASGRVETIAVPSGLDVQATYVAGVPAAAPHPALGRAFVELLTSEAGRAALRQHGFGPEPGS